MDDNDDGSKKVTKVSNPLTMIGIFAGLSETAGVVVLPLIAQTHQKYFMWYVMGFPILLVCLFFYVLIYHHVNLYAPGDFRDEKIFERLRKQQLKATASLTAAVLNKSPSRGSPNINLNEISDIVIKASSDFDSKAPNWKHRILWVDDNPENNFFERDAFENMGIEFSTALSTDEAIDLLNEKKFAAIISDMGRNEGPQEGYRLLEAIRKRGITTPYFIYAGSSSQEQKDEAIQRGAQGSTNQAHELLSMVMDGISAI